jgi:hypothetical protein
MSGAWGAGNPAYDLGGLTVNAVTADSAGVYSANTSPNGGISQPSYTVCTGASPVTTILLAQFGDQEPGNARAICVRH